MYVTPKHNKEGFFWLGKKSHVFHRDLLQHHWPHSSNHLLLVVLGELPPVAAAQRALEAPHVFCLKKFCWENSCVFFFRVFCFAELWCVFFESTYYLNRMKFVKMTKDSDTKNSKLKKKHKQLCFLDLEVNILFEKTATTEDLITSHQRLLWHGNFDSKTLFGWKNLTQCRCFATDHRHPCAAYAVWTRRLLAFRFDVQGVTITHTKVTLVIGVHHKNLVSWENQP